jgi:cold-inducible RNA-binding protein
MDRVIETLREIMNTKLYVANLPAEVTETELKELFSPSGTVVSASIAIDRDTKEQRGFAFVEMTTEAEAQAAVAAVHGKQLRGKDISVNVSTPKPKATVSQ